MRTNKNLSPQQFVQIL